MRGRFLLKLGTTSVSQRELVLIKYGVKNFTTILFLGFLGGLFGSYLHDAADEQSDLDILVELDRPTFDHYMDLKFYLEKLLGTPVDLVLIHTLKERLRSIILKEAIRVPGL